MYSIRFWGLVPWTERASGSVTLAINAVAQINAFRSSWNDGVWAECELPKDGVGVQHVG